MTVDFGPMGIDTVGQYKAYNTSLGLHCEANPPQTQCIIRGLAPATLYHIKKEFCPNNQTACQNATDDAMWTLPTGKFLLLS